MNAFTLIPQQQPDDYTCNQTCLAMLLGVPVADVIAVFGGDGMSTAELYHALERCRLWWNGLVFSDRLPYYGYYLASVPSLNFPGGGHEILIHKTSEGGETPIDPQCGREGKKWYGPDYPVLWKSELIYVAKGDSWYGGNLPNKL